jgi:hypothetical protein
VGKAADGELDRDRQLSPCVDVEVEVEVDVNVNVNGCAHLGSGYPLYKWVRKEMRRRRALKGCRP